MAHAKRAAAPRHGIHDWRLFFLVLLVVIGISLGLFCRYEEARQVIEFHLTGALAKCKEFGVLPAFLILVPLLVAGFPRLLIYNIAGLVFGFWQGLLLAQFASCGASAVIYLLSRNSDEEAPEGLGILRERAAAFGNVGFVFMARLMPLPGVLLTVGMAKLGIGLGSFLLGTFVGYLPHGVPMALLGSSIRSDSAGSSILMALVSFGAVLFVVWRFGPAHLLAACGVDVTTGDGKTSASTLWRGTIASVKTHVRWGARRTWRYSRVFLRRAIRIARANWGWILLLAIATIAADLWLFPQDRGFHKAWLEFRNPGYDHFWGRVRKWGAFTDTMVINGTIFLIGWLFHSPKLRRLALVSFLAASASGLLCNVVRSSSGRPRPRTWLKAEMAGTTVPDKFHGPRLSADYHSFPSAHTATAMGNGFCMVIAAPSVGWLALANGILVTWSCFEIRAHYLSDILTSSALGLAVGLPFAIAYRRIYRRKRNKELPDEAA